MDYDKIRNMKLYIFLFFALMAFSHPSYAQIGEISEEQREQLETSNYKTEEEIKSVNYIPATHANLAPLMWKFNIYDDNDESIVDNFLKTRNCHLYYQYYQDEFIWQNIRKGVQREIEYYAGDYPDRFQIVSFIRLGRYNFSELAFEIEDYFKLDSQGAIIFPFASYGQIGCGNSYVSTDFPELIKFIPDNKFPLLNVPMPPDKADVLLDNIKKYSYNGNKDGRTIALALNIKVNSVEDKTDMYGKTPSLLLFGQLDEIILFEDPEMTIPIWSKSFAELQ